LPRGGLGSLQDQRAFPRVAFANQARNIFSLAVRITWGEERLFIGWQDESQGKERIFIGRQGNTRRGTSFH